MVYAAMWLHAIKDVGRRIAFADFSRAEGRHLSSAFPYPNEPWLDVERMRK
jgi:hypothetical protein